ncbi:MAG: RluA family pseudouridine synthase [Acidimicrobiales bacterium]
MTERVPAALEGERIDRVVALVTGLSRAAAAGLVSDGRVRLAHRTVTSRGRRVHSGEALDIDVPDAVPPAALAPDDTVSFAVVWSDDDVVVVDKPAGVVVHPGSGHSRGTLVQGLLGPFPDISAMAEGDAAQRPGIVHRLDKGTSGLLVVARTPAARAGLATQLASRQVERRYAALVAGSVESDEGVVDAPLGRAPTDPTRIAVVAGGRPARTRYRVMERYRHPLVASLLECRLETGRTHQIRVHLAAIGHPVVGDDRYGGPGCGLGRPFLHAASLGFDHPVSGERLSFTSALPPDLVDLAGSLSA